MIDFTGPWEVFQDVSFSTRSQAPFRLYTVAEAQKAHSCQRGHEDFAGLHDSKRPRTKGFGYSSAE